MNKHRIFIFTFLALAALFMSCSKPERDFDAFNAERVLEPIKAAQPVTGQSHIWYALSKNGFSRIDFPARALKSDFAPWTESIRVCDAAMLGNGASQGAFFLVNRLGMLTFLGDGSIKLAREVIYFSDSTVDSLFIAPGAVNAPVFHHYTNDIFNSAETQRDTILIRFDPQAQLFYPALFKREIHLNPQDEVTTLLYQISDNGALGETSAENGEWFFQIKHNDGESARVDYRAVSFLESLDNPTASRKISEREISQDVFRRALENESFEEAPARLKNFLPEIPANVAFTLECRFQDLSIPKRFSLGVPAGQTEGEIEVNGHAVIADTYAAALFEDGTVYFQGALTGYPIYKNNAVTVFKLPQLPEGFFYGKCIVSGGKMFASWEERRFYETARSGFVQVNLDYLLYGEQS